MPSFECGYDVGVKGHRPGVGTRDCKQLLYVFAVVNLVSAAVHANLLDNAKDAQAKTGKSKTRRLQEAFAAHLQHVGRHYPAASNPRVVIPIDSLRRGRVSSERRCPSCASSRRPRRARARWRGSQAADPPRLRRR